MLNFNTCDIVKFSNTKVLLVLGIYRLLDITSIPYFCGNFFLYTNQFCQKQDQKLFAMYKSVAVTVHLRNIVWIAPNRVDMTIQKGVKNCSQSLLKVSSTQSEV